MPAITALTINDGQASPVAHVFDPVTTTGKVAKWVNRAGAFIGAYETLVFEVREPTTKGAAYRVIGSLTRPITALVNGVTIVVRTNKTNFDINFSQESTLAERKDDAAMIANLMANSAIKSAIQNVEPFW